MTDIRVEERRFKSWDGTELFFRAWHPRGLQKRVAVIVFHGGHEHSARFTPVVESLDLPGVSFFGWDARGHGKSPGKRGHADHFRDLVRDAKAFVGTVSNEYGVVPDDMAILGHSEGSVIAASLVLDHLPAVRGVVLGSPALRVRLYIPLGQSLLHGWYRVHPHGSVRSLVTSRLLTHDTEERRVRDEDPLIFRPIGLGALLGLLDEGERLVRDAHRIRVPALVLSAGSDWVVRLSTQRRFFERLGSERKEHVVYPGFYHEVFHERDRILPIARTRGFLTDVLTAPTRASQGIRRSAPVVA